jgi:hypothetical protein
MARIALERVGNSSGAITMSAIGSVAFLDDVKCGLGRRSQTVPDNPSAGTVHSLCSWDLRSSCLDDLRMETL